MTDLTVRINALAPAVRSLVVELARGNRVSRKAARAALHSIPKSDRGGLALESGKNILSDLANEINHHRYMRSKRHLRLRESWDSTYDNLPRVKLARRLACPLDDRMRLHIRKKVIAGAARILSGKLSYKSDWFVSSAPLYDRRSIDYTAEVRYNNLLDENGRKYYGRHNVCVSHGWANQVRRIGDGSGVVKNHFILFAKIFASSLNAEREIYEATVAIAHNEVIRVRTAYISCWPRKIATVHGTFAAAYEEHVPEQFEDLNLTGHTEFAGTLCRSRLWFADQIPSKERLNSIRTLQALAFIGARCHGRKCFGQKYSTNPYDLDVLNLPSLQLINAEFA